MSATAAAAERVTIPVAGMTCAACQATVQRALLREVGVKQARVQLVLRNADVVFDPALVTPQALVDAIRRTGYEAELPAPDETEFAAEERREREQEREFRGLRARAALALAAAGLAMVASMPLMDAAGRGHAHADPFMRWAMATLRPWLLGALPPLFRLDPAVLSWALLLLTLFVMAYAGRSFYQKAWAGLRHRTADMSTLVALGTGAAFFYSATATVGPRLFLERGLSPDVYYEAVVVILALVLLGRALEARARAQTSRALRALASLRPKTARIERDGRDVDVALSEVRSGDLVLVRPGERVPVDAELVSGSGTLDESLLTGEPRPLQKAPGDSLIGGTLNRAGAFRLRATSIGATSVLSRIVKLMREAQGSRAPVQDLADRISAVFVPAVLGLAALTFVLWLFLAGDAGWARAGANAVAVLIIACPCAMGLAVPTATMVATGRAAQLGILIKGGATLQRASRVTTVLLDKTGTVTIGKPAVVETLLAPEPGVSLQDALRLAASLEALSEHPLALAIVERAAGAGLAPGPVEGFRSLPGRGVSGLVQGRRVAVGSRAFVLEAASLPPELASPGEGMTSETATLVFVAVDGRAVARLAISDPVRPTSREAVERLQRLGLEVVLLTGDNAAAAQAVADAAGIPRVVAGVPPEGKLTEVRRLQAQGLLVAMVGDGINDAPALAQADVGIAMGGGTDVALDAGDIALLRGDLRDVAAALALARRALRTMRQNLFWAFAYNVVAIPVAAGALYPGFGILLSPVLASAAMAFSSLSVVSNSLRLRSVRLA